MHIFSLVASLFGPGGGDARPKVQAVSPQTAHEQAKAGSVLIIDVRTPDEWAQTGVAPGAAGITLQDRDFLDRLAKSTRGRKDAAIAFICRSGMRSGAAAGKARAAGYTNVYNVTGGMSMSGGWIDAGLPVERD
ncbi:MAG: rhodanese-like domain-containing protein [Alphaproteobacteria bacterium]|nr:rhodanese-like domain-containing protein [Alphaproteobacteria bacterium]